MTVLKFRLLFIGSKGEKPVQTLFDDGTNLSCINPDCIKDIAVIQTTGRVRKITGFDGSSHEVKQVTVLDFLINDILLSDEFFIVPHLPEEAIIGAATLRKWRIKLNFKEKAVEVNPALAQLQLV